MTDETKDPIVDQKNSAQEQAQLSEKELDKVSGGGTPQKSEDKPTESVSISYSEVEKTTL